MRVRSGLIAVEEIYVLPAPNSRSQRVFRLEDPMTTQTRDYVFFHSIAGRLTVIGAVIVILLVFAWSFVV
jgi:hypothetical protein